MDEKIFILDVEDGQRNFVCNRDTGKWVLSPYVSKEVAELLSKKPVQLLYQGVSMFALNVSRICNLNCDYCLAKEARYETGVMNQETGKLAIDRISELPPEQKRVVFHGSEPMTNFQLIKELVSYNEENSYNIKFSMQSNGTLFNDRNLEFLLEHDVGIGISLDGLGEHQNRNRPFANGEGSFKKVIENIRLLKKLNRGVSVISVINSNNVDDILKITRYFESEGVSGVLFSPVSPHEGYTRMPNQKILYEKMSDLFDWYIGELKKGSNPIKIRNIRDLTRLFFVENLNPNCVKCGGGVIHPLLAIDIDGSIYPCDYFLGKEKYKIGGIQKDSIKDVINSPLNFRAYRDINKIEDCRACNWKRYCGGGCPGSSEMNKGEILAKNDYCEYTTRILEYVAKKIPEFHKEGLLKKILGID